jgi:hypothetical protein
MTVHITDVDEIVDRPPADFDKNASTADLQWEQSDLEGDVSEVGFLIRQLTDFIDKAETRISEIEDELEAREDTSVTA